MARFTQEEQDLVTAAVTAAEARSDGEIVTIVAERSEAYHDVGLHYAILAMLLVPVVWGLLPQSVIDWGLALVFGWNHELGRGALMTLLFVKLAGAFLVVRYALAWMPLRMALTPRATKARRVRRRALEYFHVAADRRTIGRTGVLLYLSLLERRAEIVADAAIDAKVKPEVWGQAMAALVADVKAGRPAHGMAEAVRIMGDVLAEHFPKTGSDTNELPDSLIEL
jgi:putative membrane protein